MFRAFELIHLSHFSYFLIHFLKKEGIFPDDKHKVTLHTFLCSEWFHAKILDSARAMLMSWCWHTYAHKGNPTDLKEVGKESSCEKIRWLGRRGTVGCEPLTLYSLGAPAAERSAGFLFPLQEAPLHFLQHPKVGENSRHSELSCITWAFIVSACWAVSSLWKFELAQATFLVLPGKIS